MKKIYLGALILAIALVTGASMPASADVETWYTGYPGPEDTWPAYPDANTEDISFFAVSLVQSTDGETGPFYYYWEIQNYSTVWEILGWTWSYEAGSGNVMDLGVYDDVNSDLPDPFPLPPVIAENPPTYWVSISALDGEDSGRVKVNSSVSLRNTVTQATQSVDFRIYAPSALVPEPSAFAALAGGLVGLGGLIRRKR